jgi:hypothetical protein
MATLHPHIERLRVARDRLVRLRTKVESSEPVPEDDPGERDWVPCEILAHVDEMLPYWLGEIERVLEGPEEPVPFGRLPTDPIRAMTVERDRALPICELYARLDAGMERIVMRLLELDEKQCARRGLHQTRGEMTVRDIVGVMLAGHLEEHCDQLAATLEAGGEPAGQA